MRIGPEGHDWARATKGAASGAVMPASTSVRRVSVMTSSPGHSYGHEHTFVLHMAHGEISCYSLWWNASTGGDGCDWLYCCWPSCLPAAPPISNPARLS